METEIKNAFITRATLSIADHGVLSSFISLDYGGSGQGFGGYCLGKPGDTVAQQGGHAARWICRVLEIAGVDEWSKLNGRPVRVKAEHGKVHAIGHLTDDDWFNPTEDFAEALLDGA